MPYIISDRLCPQNHSCPIIRICPVQAISQDGYKLPIIDKSKCTECGKCKKHCPKGAVDIME